MKKMTKKALLMATVFSAAMNINACGYGPPEDYVYDTEVSENQVQEEVSEVEKEENGFES